eukprot:767492-Hanusia_phi.AAC.5
MRMEVEKEQHTTSPRAEVLLPALRLTLLVQEHGEGVRIQVPQWRRRRLPYRTTYEAAQSDQSEALECIYYPTASFYYGGGARANFGPNFRFPPEEDFKPISECAILRQRREVWSDVGVQQDVQDNENEESAANGDSEEKGKQEKGKQEKWKRKDKEEEGKGAKGKEASKATIGKSKSKSKQRRSA